MFQACHIEIIEGKREAVINMKTKCNNCGASLEMDWDNLMSYCPFCRSKLLIEIEDLSQVLKEKEITKQTEVREENKTKRQLMKYEYEEREKTGKRKTRGKIAIVASILVLASVISLRFGDDFLAIILAMMGLGGGAIGLALNLD